MRWIVLRADVDREHAGSRRVVGIAMDVTAQHARSTRCARPASVPRFITSHAGIGTWEADADGCGAGTSRCSTCAASRRARRRRAARSGWRSSTPTTRRSSSKGLRMRGSAVLPTEYEFRVRQPDGELPLARVALGPGARRLRPPSPARRRQLGRHREQERRAGAPAGRARGARDPGQVAVSLAHEPRAAHAAQRGARLHPAAADRGAPVRARRASSPSSSTSATPATICSR